VSDVLLIAVLVAFFALAIGRRVDLRVTE